MAYISDSPPIPNGNGLVQYLPVEIMPTLPRKNKERVRYPPCNCCPYGYHIDLDFVRFLEALSQGSEISANKQRRRERRRQRQSMEVLLGLTSPSVWNLEQQLPQIPAEPPPSPAPPDPIHTNAMVRDALYKAVVEFEETLERSHPKPIANTILQSHHSPGQHAAETDGPELGSSPMQRAESVSSVSSMSAASSTATPEQNVPNQDFDVASVGSAASGLSTGALQNIREQMAISLERMRELEEQVKLIPVLQVQLAVLKEEKRQMLLQLRLEEAERNKRNMTDHSSSAVIGHGKSGPGVETSSRVRSQSCSEGSDRNSPRSPIPNEIRSSFRDVGVTCSVMTREVGISPQQPRLRNVKTNTVTQLEYLGVRGIQSEDIPPDESICPINFKLVKSTIIHKKPESCVSAVNTDLLMDQVYSDMEMDRNINKAIKTYEKSFRNKLYNKNTREIGIQAENKTDISLLIVERRDMVIQTEDSHGYRDVLIQTEDLQSRLVDVGILVKPRSIDTAIEFKPKTRDIGVSNNTIIDIICEKCQVKKRSIGVGYHIANSVDETSISLSNIGIFQSKSPDNVSIPVTKQISTRSIACGTHANVSLSQGTDTNDLNAGTSRDFGVNTTKRKLVDAAVGDAERMSGSGVFLCDKCDAKIQNVAKNMLTQNSEPSVPSPSVSNVAMSASVSSRTVTSSSSSTSRIPRPATSASVTRSVTPSGLTTTAHSQEKHRFQRQDTYTKLQVSTPSPTPPPPEKLKNDRSSICPAERLLAMQASAAREQDREPGQQLSGSEAEEDEGETPEDETNAIMDAGLFQPIQQEKRQKREPSKEMKAALKVLNDYLRKFPITNVPHHLKNATNIVQQEWFKISSTASANPLDVEDYLDCFEEMSSTLLEFVVNMTDMSGNTAMHYAVSHGNFDVVSILLDSKVCNINRPNAAGYTCVMLVSLAQVRSETHRQVVRRLFQLADVNVRAKQHGQTALMLAVSHGRLDMVKLLVEAGADMNIQDEDGSTALMCAAEHGHIAIVKHLISQPDCDVSIADCDGSSALNIAMDAGNKDIGVLLYAHEHFSRGSSPYTSLRHRRSKSATPTVLSGTPPSPSPVRERVSRHEQLT